MNKFFENNGDYFYFVFRVIVGLGFMLHGIPKIQGILAGKTALTSLMFYAGVIEFIGGAFIIIGLLTRITAIIAALEMLYAYIFVHMKAGVISPLANKGELSLLYFAAFLVIAALGARKWGLDKLKI